MRFSREVALAFMRVSAPFSLTLPLVVLGYFLKPAAYLLLFSLVFVLLWALALLCYVFISLFRRRPIGHLLVGLLACWLTIVSAAQVIYGVPRWVKANAQSVVGELEGWKSGHGSYPALASADAEFPPALRKVLHRAQCDGYRPTGSGYKLTCRGVLFTKCTFDSLSQRWSSWD
jgi:hypothetical protein